MRNRSHRFWLCIAAAVAVVVVAVPAASAGVGKDKTFKYTSTYSSVSTANGYPRPGGTANLLGSTTTKPVGGGTLTDHLTITKRLAPHRFAFKGKGVDDFGTGDETHGHLFHRFTGTITVRADHSQQLAIEGHFTGGHLRLRVYADGRDLSGRYSGTATVTPGATGIVGVSKGRLSMHRAMPYSIRTVP